MTTYSHAEQLAIIESLCESGAAGSIADLRKAVMLWEACTRPNATPAERQRIEAILAACGVLPAKEYDL